MNDKYPSPWNESKAWRTKAEFFTWLRSGLRKSAPGEKSLTPQQQKMRECNNQATQ